MTNASEEQKKLIVSRLGEGVTVQEISDEFGVSLGSIRSIKAHIKMGTYRNLFSTEDEEILEAAEATFGLERDMQEALRKNISQLEDGLQISDGGKERIVSSGRIDIMARDSDNTAVVIELKAGTASPSALTQLLSYMGSISDEENGKVRGILVASNFDPKIVHALKVASNVELRKYRFSFKFDSVK